MKEIVYPSLAHRIISAWATTIPPFHPLSTDHAGNKEKAATLPPSEESQRHFHTFLSQAATGLSQHPEWLDLPLLPDDGYEHFELLNQRPELNTAMHKIKRKINDFLYLLLQIGMAGEPTEEGNALCIPKSSLRLAEKTRTRLAHIGLTVQPDKTDLLFFSQAYPHMASAWHWLAVDAFRTAPQTGKKNEPPLRFVHALFDETHPSGPAFFRLHCADEPGLPNFLDWLEKQGYKTFSNRDNRTTADWVKSYGKNPEPLKDAWAERSHGGFAMEYEWVKKRPVLYALRVPEYRKLLGRFSAMPPHVRSLVVRHTKHCDNCGYCTQTDKTGTRSKAFVAVEHEGKHALCTMFPGFGYTFRELDEPLVSAFKDFLLFIDTTLTGDNA